MEAPDIAAILRLLDSEQTEGQIAVDEASYFLSKLDLTRGKEKTMPGWRKRLFIGTSKFSTDASVYFGLPEERTVIMGERVEV
jgi:KUP system potassium uptake protein